MMRALASVLGLAFGVVTLGVSLVHAQQSQDQQQTPQDQQQTPGQSAEPIPAYRSPLASLGDNADVQSQQSDQGTPDNRSLSGAQDLSPLLLSTRSYWQPQVNALAIVDSNPGELGSGTDWTTGAVVSGRVDVHRMSGSSALDLSYVGGASFFGNGYGTGIVQALGISDKITLRRSVLSFIDQVSYLPGSSFGYGGLGGLAGGTLPATGSTGLGPVFGPGQTILTGEGQTLQNSFVTELDTELTPRSTLTLAGGDYVEHYFTSGLLNSNNVNARAGYNYALTDKDKIAVFYTFSSYGYGETSTPSPESTQSVNTHTVQFSYGRLLARQLTFQVAAGPEYITSSIPISVSGPTISGPASQLEWTLNTSLSWITGRNTLRLSYYHGANGGSGVFAGSIGDTVSGSLTRAMSRTFTSGISGGYSRNQGTVNSSGVLLSQTYAYTYGGVSLSHPVGAALGLTLSYWVQYQNSSSGSCVGSPCVGNILTNLISFGVGWHPRPLAF
jgi:hypothetical protein